VTERIKKLRGLMNEAEVDAFFVTRPENLFYLSGFSGSAGSVLVGREQSYLFADFRYIVQAAQQSPGFIIVEVPGSSHEQLHKVLEQEAVVTLGCEGDHLAYSQYVALQEGLSEIDLKPFDGLVEKLRLSKDNDEIATLEEAVRLADEAFKEILEAIKPGKQEREVALQLEYAMRRRGAERAAFTIIVAAGRRSAMPHAVASEKTIQYGDLIIMDFGAVYRGYHSDITRTVVLGKPAGCQLEIYDIVLEAQQRGIAAVRPAVKAMDVDRAARDVIEWYGYGKCFGHSTGHGLGLQIHEKPWLSARDETVLQPGMVVTVEPGIYLPGWGGIRIEDTVLVTPDGHRVLTRSPKQELIALG